MLIWGGGDCELASRKSKLQDELTILSHHWDYQQHASVTLQQQENSYTVQNSRSINVCVINVISL